MLGRDRETFQCGSLCLCPRLLHSLTNLKRVIINAAHYLVLGDKDIYRHDPAVPFLSTVSCPLPRGSLHPGSAALPPRSVLRLGRGSQPCPCPWAWLARVMCAPQR